MFLKRPGDGLFESASAIIVSLLRHLSYDHEAQIACAMVVPIFGRSLLSEESDS